MQNPDQYLGHRDPVSGVIDRYPALYVNGGAFAYAGPASMGAWCDLGGGYFYVMPPSVVAEPDVHNALAAHVQTLLTPPAPVVLAVSETDDWRTIVEEAATETTSERASKKSR